MQEGYYKVERKANLKKLSSMNQLKKVEFYEPT